MYGFKSYLNGGMAEYAILPKGSINYRVPEELSMEQAALIEPMACSLHGVRQGSVQKDDVVVLAGAGTLSAASIPVAVPNTGYRAGSWDVDPETSANGITGNVVYTYTCMLADDLSYTLTFPVKPGTAAMLRLQHVSVCFKASGMAVTPQRSHHPCAGMRGHQPCVGS